MGLVVIKYELLPESFQGDVQRWIEHGIHPGGFLFAVISNNLRGAVAYADDLNIAYSSRYSYDLDAALAEIVRWFHSEAPASCWGSPERASAWAAGGGIKRQEKQ